MTVGLRAQKRSEEIRRDQKREAELGSNIWTDCLVAALFLSTCFWEHYD